MLLAVMVTATAAAAAAAAATSKTAKSAPVLLGDCAVALHSGASPGEAFAASELALISGNLSNGNTPLPYADIAGGRPSCTLAVGYGASVAAGMPTALASELSKDEGYLIRLVGDGKWAITGAQGSARGAMLGVYEFIERLGFRQLAWDCAVLPVGAPHAQIELTAAALQMVQPRGSPSGVNWREYDDWDNFNDRNLSRRLRYNGGNGAFDCVYHLHGETEASCAGPDAWDQCPGGNCWATPPGPMHSIYFLLCTNGTDPNPHGHCGKNAANDSTHVPGRADLLPRQDLIQQHPEWFYPHPAQCETAAQQKSLICLGPFPSITDCQLIRSRFCMSKLRKELDFHVAADGTRVRMSRW
eukprot:COSAG05_NODE_1473_length_4788_cov_2.548305_7_plen_357_part_00